ncbi:unnamed protein product [Calicophoron daubneyi]|uniref:Pericentrin/AKAP-450 centrosomal targeting domain-containing protein n=1 Tax=Calicophoron daubneyi TaxID=300641 RepID=A0AAV2TY40_CALDB
MDVLYHELAAGKDSSLSQVLAAWSKRYEERYESLRAGFAYLFGDSATAEIPPNGRRPKSADLTRSNLAEFRDQFEEVLNLKATLSVEVEALQQIRAELEDSQSMSEVHIQLERATLENRRLQSAIRVAHEQVADLFFNKRILEAEMAALRSDRDQQLAEANERVRMAERAVVAATSRRFDQNLTSKSAGSSPARAVQSQLPGIVTSKQITKGPVPSESPVGIGAARRKMKDTERFKSYATLTGMSFEEFDSLDEDEEDEDQTIDQNRNDIILDSSEECLSRTRSPDTKRVDLACTTDTEETSKSSEHPSSEPVPPPSPGTSDVPTDQNYDASAGDALPPPPPAEPIAPASPTSSSTPRKALEKTTDNASGNPQMFLLKDASAEWATPLRNVDVEMVPKKDYLALLDQLDEVRQEVEKYRQKYTSSTLSEHSTNTEDVADGALDLSNSTTQLRDLTDEAKHPSMKNITPTPRGNLLPPRPPGSTRLFDWSVSPNQSTRSVEAQTYDGEWAGENEKTPTQSPLIPVCDKLLEYEAKLLANEAVASAQIDVLSSFWCDRVNLQEARLQFLETQLEDARKKPQTVSVAAGDSLEVATRSVEQQCVHSQRVASTQTVGKPDDVRYIDSQTEFTMPAGSEKEDNLTAALRRYSKLSADAACICLALAQRIASLNPRGTPDGEQTGESNEGFNELLTALSVEQPEGSSITSESHRTGYRILPPALTQLNYEVERLAVRLDAGPIDGSGKSPMNDDIVDKDSEVAELRTRLEAALQLLTEKLPTDTKKALLETSQIVEDERLQLQAELERRMVQFEQSHASSLNELESSRRALLEQLAVLETNNLQLRDELGATQKKLQANERFLVEQTDEREAEREEFRSEVARLNDEIKTLKEHPKALPNALPAPTQDSPQDAEIPFDFGPHWMVGDRGQNESPGSCSPVVLVVDTVSHSPSNEWDSKAPRDFQASCGALEGLVVNCRESWRFSPTDFTMNSEDGEPASTIMQRDRSETLGMSIKELSDTEVQTEDAGCTPLPSAQNLKDVIGPPEVESPHLLDVTVQTTDDLGRVSSTTFSIEMVDASVNTDAETDQSKGGQGSKTVTTTTVTRTLGASAAAALLSSLTVTEQSTVVTVDQQTSGGPQTTHSSVDEKVGEANSSELRASDSTSHSVTLHGGHETMVTESPPSASASGSPCLTGDEQSDKMDLDSGIAQTPVGESVLNSASLNKNFNSSSVLINKGAAPDSIRLIGSENKCMPVRSQSCDTGTSHEMKDSSCTTDELDLEFVPTSTLSDLIGQNEAQELLVTSLRAEIENLNKYQDELQNDYNTLQRMLDERDSEMVRHTQETLTLQEQCASLERQLKEHRDAVRENDEDLFLMTEERNSLLSKVSELEGKIEMMQSIQKLQASLPDRVEASTQTMSSPVFEVAIMTSAAPSPTTEAICADTDEHVVDDPSDTIRDDSSPMPSLSESLNSDEEVLTALRSADLKVGLAATSTPGAVAPRAAVDVRAPSDMGIMPQELESLITRLREESLRLFSLALGCNPSQLESTQPGGKMVTPEGHLNQSGGVDSDHSTKQTERPQKPALLSDLIQANMDLKKALNSFAKTLGYTETPACTSAAPSELHDSTNHIRALVQALVHALSTDEHVWMTMLNSSIMDSTGAVLKSLQPAMTSGDTSQAKIIWTVISRMVDQVVAFMYQEDKYRKCLIEAHRVEQSCLSSELGAALNRSEDLSDEIGRLTEQLASHKQALSRADSLNLRLANQVTNLKNELSSATTDLQSQKTKAEQEQMKADRFNSQLLDEQRKVVLLRTKLEATESEKSHLEQDLKKLDDELQNTKIALNSEKKKVESSPNINSSAHYSQPKEPAVPSTKRVENGHSCMFPNGTTPPSSMSTPKGQHDLLHALSRTATELAVARHAANKAERRAKELQETNRSLRLGLVETELRLMPMLAMANFGCGSNGYIESSDSRTAPVQHSDGPPPEASSRFAELKNMCSQLLSMVSSEDRDEDSSSDSSDGADPVDPPASSHSVSFNSVTSASRPANISGNFRATPLQGAGHPDDNRSSTNFHETDSATGDLPVPGSPATLQNRPGDSLQPGLMFHTDLSRSVPPANNDQTVSLERFRNVHSRYLRAESYRRALTFQKRYLLLLLGGFQYSEETIVEMIARPESSGCSQFGLSAVDPNTTFLSPISSLRRFRAAARTVQVIYRMRHMVKRWRRSGLHSVSAQTTSTETTIPALTNERTYNFPPSSLAQSFYHPVREIPTYTHPFGLSSRTPLRELGIQSSENLTNTTTYDFITLPNSHLAPATMISANPCTAERLSGARTSTHFPAQKSSERVLRNSAISNTRVASCNHLGSEFTRPRAQNSAFTAFPTTRVAIPGGAAPLSSSRPITSSSSPMRTNPLRSGRSSSRNLGSSVSSIPTATRPYVPVAGWTQRVGTESRGQDVDAKTSPLRRSTRRTPFR